jgi:hypothetical protein
LSGRSDHLLNIENMRQVRGAIHRSDAVFLLHPGAHRRDLPLVAKAIDYDIASGGGESLGRGEAETLRRSSDECALALEHRSRLPL